MTGFERTGAEGVGLRAGTPEQNVEGIELPAKTGTKRDLLVERAHALVDGLPEERLHEAVLILERLSNTPRHADPFQGSEWAGFPDPNERL